MSSDEPHGSEWWRRHSSTVITALALFGAEYNAQAISWAQLWLDLTCDSPSAKTVAGEVAFLASMLIGMAVFGLLGDTIGIKRALTATLIVQTVGALAQAIIPWGSDTSVWVLLIVARTLLGIGAGGVYPLAAAKAAADARNPDADAKAHAVAWVFFWRYPADILVYLFGGLLYLGPGAGATFADGREALALAALGSQRSSWDATWRVHLGCGCLVPGIAAYLAAHEPTRAATVGLPLRETLRRVRATPRAYRTAVATACPWLLVELAVYGQAHLQSRLLDAAIPNTAVMARALAHVGIACVGLLAVVLLLPSIPRAGLRQLQLGGLGLVSALCLVLAGVWGALASVGSPFLAIVLAAALCAALAVVRTTTFCMPSTSYEIAICSTMGGLAAAASRVGALAGAAGFGALVDAGSHGGWADGALQLVLGLCGAATLAAIACTVFGAGGSLAAPPRGAAVVRPLSSHAAVELLLSSDRDSFASLASLHKQPSGSPSDLDLGGPAGEAFDVLDNPHPVRRTEEGEGAGAPSAHGVPAAAEVKVPPGPMEASAAGDSERRRVTIDLRGVVSANAFHDAASTALGASTMYRRSMHGFADAVHRGVGAPAAPSGAGAELLVLCDRDVAAKVPEWSTARGVLSESRHAVSFKYFDVHVASSVSRDL